MKFVQRNKDRGLSLSKACLLAGIHRSLYYYHLGKARNKQDQTLLERIKKLKKKHPVIGAKKLAKLLSSEVEVFNHKRIARILRENDLQVKRKPRVRRARSHLLRLPTPKKVEKKNELWGLDFMCSRKNNRFRFMLLNALDVCSREAVRMIVERSFTSYDVTHELEIAMEIYGKPAGIVTDNGAEFTAAHFRLWCKRQRITHYLTEKASPAQNCYIESFNSSVRRELLDRNDFESLDSLRKKVSSWHEFYNQERPHGALNYQSPQKHIMMHKN